MRRAARPVGSEDERAGLTVHRLDMASTVYLLSRTVRCPGGKRADTTTTTAIQQTLIGTNRATADNS